MEGIGSLSQQTFQDEQKFQHYLDPRLADRLDTIEFTNADFEKTLDDSMTPRTQDDVCTWLSSSYGNTTDGRTDPATLKLVRVVRKLDVTLCIRQSTFVRILDLMKADPSVKYMICRDYDGFHEFYTLSYRLTRFMGTAYDGTFDPLTMDITAIFIDCLGFTFTAFTETLQAFRKLIHTLLMLCFVSGYFILR